MEDKEERKKELGRSERAIYPRGEKGLLLDREETDVAHRQMAVYKGKRGKVLG